MKIKPEELPGNGFILLDALNHKELIPFIRTYLKKKTKSSLLFNLSNLFCFALTVFFFFYSNGRNNFTFWKGLNHFSYGIGIAFLLVPFHEYIHALAYKYVGAENTSYDANLKKFYFMAMADKFVASRREFRIVALAPFVIISSVLLISMFFAGTLWIFTFLGILMTHTAFSSGDFGLLCYFEFHKDKEVVTYDDKSNGVSFFLWHNK